MMAQDQKDALKLQFKASEDAALDMLIDAAYDLGKSEAPQGSFSQADVDAAHASGVQDGKIEEKADLKGVVDSAIDAAP